MSTSKRNVTRCNRRRDHQRDPWPISEKQKQQLEFQRTVERMLKLSGEEKLAARLDIIERFPELSRNL